MLYTIKNDTTGDIKINPGLNINNVRRLRVIELFFHRSEMNIKNISNYF